MGKDFRNAYVPGVTLTGTGQSVGLLAFEAFYTNDITKYESMAGLPNVPIQVVLVDGFNGIPVTADSSAIDEASIDVEMAISMAPSLSSVVAFDAGPYNNNGSYNDILNAMAAHPQIKQFSSSWSDQPKARQAITSSTDGTARAVLFPGFGRRQTHGSTTAVYRLISGTDGLSPCDDPYLTSVGGTSLTMNGSGASYASEQVWNFG